MEYLNSRSDSPDDIKNSHSISPRALSGAFASDYKKMEGRLASTIRFSEATHESFIEFALIEYNDDTLRLPETFEEEIEQLKLAKIKVQRYRGFAVITPEENLLLFGKHEDTHTNLIFMSLGIDNSIFLENADMNGLVLLKHNFPVDFIEISTNEDHEKLSVEVENELASKIYSYRRIEEDYTDKSGDS